MSRPAGLKQPRVPFADGQGELRFARTASTTTTGAPQSRHRRRATSRSNAWVWLSWAGLIVFVLSIGVGSQSQWDFRVFHNAPAVVATGSNPYATDPDLGYPPGLTYLYPPLALYVFKPLSLMPFRLASLIWFALKLAALMALLYLWHRNFERLTRSWLAIAVLAFGFNAPILKDLTAGNISIFEQLGLWFGFCLLLWNRFYLAGFVIALTAQFKLIPIVFLGLLLIVEKPQWKPFTAAAALFGLVFLSNYLVAPELTRQYVATFSVTDNSNLDERGAINPSSLAFIRDLADKAARKGVPVSRSVADLAFLVYAGLLGVAAVAYVRYRAAIHVTSPRWLIYFACVLFVLAMPRVKDYSYIVLLIPALFAARQLLHGALAGMWYLPLLVVLLVPHVQFGYYYAGIPAWLHAYQPWLLAWCLLYYLIRLPVDEAEHAFGAATPEGMRMSYG